MSGAVNTVEKPQGSDDALDASVTELLALLGGGGQAAANGTAPAKASWAAGKAPTGPRGGMAEAEYDTLLQAAMPAITAAQALPTVTPKAKPAVDSIDEAINAAATLGGQKNFEGAAAALRRATAQAQAAQAATRDDFTARHATAVKVLATRPARIGALATPPAAVTTALRAATDARDAATAASTANPPNWTVAFTKLGEFNAAIAPVDAACLTAAQTQLTDLEQRYATVNAGKPVGRVMVSRYSDCNAARKRVATLVGRADGLGALEAGSSAEAATVALEAAGNPSDLVKQQRIAVAVTRLTNLTDKDIKKLPLLDKAEIAFDLCSNKKPTDRATLNQLIRLYNNSPPDKAFLKKREQQRKEIVGKVAAMPVIADLYDKKGKFDAAKWKTFIADPDKVKDLMEQVSHAQADTLGIPRIPIRKDPDPPQGANANGDLNFGGYQPGTNSIGLNLHADCLEPADEALGTILHEMFHAHQDFMVRKLKDGEIDVNDPDYPTALMYMVNDIPVGYLFPPNDGDPDAAAKHRAYASQPTEIDAEDQGKAAALDVLLLARKNAKSKK